jgi:hypothetical protein
MPDYSSERCDGHHEKVDLRLRKIAPLLSGGPNENPAQRNAGGVRASPSQGGNSEARRDFAKFANIRRFT